jgi:uncharacterized protein (UPF0332 family)
MSEQALHGAEILLREADYRGCVSRAYYAAYCAAASEIVQKVTAFSYSWQNPSHAKVPNYIQNNLSIPQAKKDTLATLINTLRLFREDADYRPQISVDEQFARDCVRDAAAVQQELWGGTK